MESLSEDWVEIGFVWKNFTGKKANDKSAGYKSRVSVVPIVKDLSDSRFFDNDWEWPLGRSVGVEPGVVMTDFDRVNPSEELIMGSQRHFYFLQLLLLTYIL